MIAEYADVLRAQGHRVRLQADGWYASRVVRDHLQCTRYLANPADRHAALTLAVTELGSLTLREALGQLMESGRIEDPVLAKLEAPRRGRRRADRLRADGGRDRGAGPVRRRDALARRRAAARESAAAAGGSR